MGLQFDQCNDFLLSFHFEECNLNFSSFYKLKLRNAAFRNCKMNSVDFTKTDLTAALFQNCDLKKAVFHNSILEKADFRTAYNYSMDPETNRIAKAKFSKERVIGLLMKYNISIE